MLSAAPIVPVMTKCPGHFSTLSGCGAHPEVTDNLGFRQRLEAVEQARRSLAQVFLELAEIELGPRPVGLEPEMMGRGIAGERQGGNHGNEKGTHR
jgi:hypothetical protein